MFAPLIVGLPRTGFSLTASVLIHIFNLVPNKFGTRQQTIRYFCETVGQLFKVNLYRSAARCGVADDLLLNDNFANLAGGPIWNNDALGPKAYFRKYIGIKGYGDFTLLTANPIELLDQYEIVHSHGPFSSWLEPTPYIDYQRFASYRNPAAVVNSACHSINALASEYLQLFGDGEDEHKLRRDLAFYKLSDEKFFRALLSPLKRGLEDQLSTWHEFNQVQWEELVTDPRKVISWIAQTSGQNLTDGHIENIWKEIGFKNLTGAHKHNFRKGFVGDEYKTLTNEHIEIMSEMGFDTIFEQLGYEKPEFNPKTYTDFQEIVSKSLKSKSPHDPLKDRTLFDLAFNKSNIDFEGFNFRQYDWRQHSRLERSNIDDDYFELAMWEAAEQSLGVINLLIEQLLFVLDGGADPQNFEYVLDEFSSSFDFMDLKDVQGVFKNLLELHLREQNVV